MKRASRYSIRPDSTIPRLVDDDDDALLMNDTEELLMRDLRITIRNNLAMMEKAKPVGGASRTGRDSVSMAPFRQRAIQADLMAAAAASSSRTPISPGSQPPTRAAHHRPGSVTSTDGLRPSTAAHRHPTAPSTSPSRKPPAGLRRISFVAAKNPSGLKNFPFSHTPTSGRFSPTGGFYVDERLEYDFSVTKSSLLSHRNTAESETTDAGPPTTAGGTSPLSALPMGVDKKKKNKGGWPEDKSDSDSDGSSADDGEGKLKKRRGSEVVTTPTHGGISGSGEEQQRDEADCVVTLWIPVAETNNTGLRSLLRQFSHDLPEQGTKLVIVMRRLIYNDELSDVTMTFLLEKVKQSKALAGTFHSIARQCALTDTGKRRGKWVVCPANTDLEDYFYRYCSLRLAEESPARAPQAAVFIAHRKQYADETKDTEPVVDELLRVSSTADIHVTTPNTITPFSNELSPSRAPPGAVSQRMADILNTSDDAAGDSDTDTSSDGGGSSDLVHGAKARAHKRRSSAGFFHLTKELVHKAKVAQVTADERAAALGHHQHTHHPPHDHKHGSHHHGHGTHHHHHHHGAHAGPKH